MLMSFLVCSITLVMTISFVILPVRERQKRRARKAFEEDFRFAKLMALKRRYSALQDMSFREIEEEYDVDSIYFNL
ncbi:hypothetical protein OAO01_00240 [Oligoflexia bacterium]|nr:hypothetical protein [Oligoflexia bacterium]